MKTHSYFVARDEATHKTCEHVHVGLGEAFACARELGFGEVWRVEARGPMVVPRARSKVRR